MNRLALACACLLLAAPEPAPQPAAEPVYLLRFEEAAASYSRPALSLAAPSPKLEEEVIHTTEIYIVSDQYFRLKMKHLEQTRELRGSLTKNPAGEFVLDVAYSTEVDPLEKSAVKDRKDRTSGALSTKPELGKRVCLGGSKSSSLTTRSHGSFRSKVPQETYASHKFWVTLLLEKPQSE